MDRQRPVAKVDPIAFKKALDVYKDLSPYEQGRASYAIGMECPYARGSEDGREWKRGEIAASLDDEMG